MDTPTAPYDTFDIVPTHLAVQAMRDNGYKNAAYALAELMDNAIEAGAAHVELLCAEKEMVIDQRTRKRVEGVAVLDNGVGMTADTLRMALQFGNGTRLAPAQHKGMGRFGMGLPASSISQCTCVDVWTWQNGPDSALHTYLDLHEINEGKMGAVPPPVPNPIPDLWREMGEGWGPSGTLVVWTNLDRCVWKTAQGIIENSEKLIGRMYRRFLKNDKVKIRMASFQTTHPHETLRQQYALPNDPGYLMRRTDCPAPFSDSPMFEPWGDPITHSVWLNGKTHTVKTTFSIAKEEARAGFGAGGKNHGRHAAKNIGVSIMRAGRELDLDQSYVKQYDEKERWWGIEVEFSPALDELFGVTNNKQSARTFVDLARFDVEAEINRGGGLASLMSQMTIDRDPRGPLLEIGLCIQKQIKGMRDHIELQNKGQRTAAQADTEHTSASQIAAEAKPTPETVATERTAVRRDEGHISRSDVQEKQPPQKRETEIKERLIQQGAMKTVAEGIAARLVKTGKKFEFNDAPEDGDAFFAVKSVGGTVIITLNTNHPAYGRLGPLLYNTSMPEAPNDTAEILKMLLQAWARYEDELPEGTSRLQAAHDARAGWGRIARDFFE